LRTAARWRGNGLPSALLELDVTSQFAGPHLVLSMLWLASFGVSKAAESILFAMLTGLVIIMSRTTAPVWTAAWKSSWSLVLFTSLLVWIWCSGAWAPHQANPEALPSRFLLVPWLLVPGARSWTLLVGAFVAGQGFQASWVVIEALLAAWGVPSQALGSSGDPYQWRYLLAFACPLAFASAYFWRGYGRLIPLTVSGLLLLAVALLGSRTPLIAAALALPVVALMLMLRKGVPLRWSAAGVGLAISLVAAALAINTPGRARLTQSMREMASGEANAALSTRPVLWTLALEGIPEAPILGHGRAAFGTRLVECADDEGSAVRRHWGPAGPTFRGAHCTYLDLLYEQGALGLFLLAALLWALGWKSRSAPLPLACGLLGGLTVWSVAGVAESNLNTRSGLVTLGLLVVMALAADCCLDRSDDTRIGD
jgi:O-antigen ligase